jgi:hypothetical protein
VTSPSQLRYSGGKTTEASFPILPSNRNHHSTDLVSATFPSSPCNRFAQKINGRMGVSNKLTSVMAARTDARLTSAATGPAKNAEKNKKYLCPSRFPRPISEIDFFGNKIPSREFRE